MKKILFCALAIFPGLVFAQKKHMGPKSYDLVVGTYTSGTSKGISVYRFYPESGRLAYLNQIEGVSNPSYLAVSNNNKFIYAVNENDQGEVSAFHFDGKTGKMDFINKQSTLGGAPCYVTVDKGQKNLLVANYSGGNIAVLPLNEDGSIAPAALTIAGDSRKLGPNKERQEKSHVHTAVLSPDEKQVLYTDLGADQIHIAKYKAAKKDQISQGTVISVKPGDGPRHIAFSNDKKFMYLITEMGSSVVVFDYNGGKPKQRQEISLLPDNPKGQTGAADIHLSPDGKFLYASNRGDYNDISVFSVNPENGELTFVQRTPSGGKGPRNFIIDPSGKYLLVAHQYTDDIVVFKIDQETGKLIQAVNRVEIGNPVCLKFAAVE